MDFPADEQSFFAGTSRGDLNRPRIPLSLLANDSEQENPLYPPADAPVPHTHLMGATPPPLTAGRYLVHRSWSGDRYWVWSLVDGSVVHRIPCEPSMGLSSAPVGYGCGVGMFVTPTRWEHYSTAPDFVEEPYSIEFPFPVCKNSAPLLIPLSKLIDRRSDRHYVVAALQDGLAMLSLHSLDIHNPELVVIRKWNHSAGYFSPVWFASAEESNLAIVTTHPHGALYWVSLSKTMQVLEEGTIECLKDRGSDLLPPVVTPEGLWLFRVTSEGVEFACVASPSALHATLSWRLAARFTPNPAALEWTPLVVGIPPSPDDPRPYSRQPRILLLGRDQFIDVNLYRLEPTASEIQPVRVSEGARLHPALAQVQGHSALLADSITGHVYLYSLPQAQLRELSSLGTHHKNLIGGPAFLDGSIVWPTRYGLYVQRF